MFSVTRSMAARATSAMPYTVYSPARFALRTSRSCSGAVQASARSRRARPSSAAGPGAGRGPALSWAGTLSVDAGEVTVHRLGPRSDNGRNDADATGPPARTGPHSPRPGPHARLSRRRRPRSGDRPAGGRSRRGGERRDPRGAVHGCRGRRAGAGVREPGGARTARGAPPSPGPAAARDRPRSSRGRPVPDARPRARWFAPAPGRVGRPSAAAPLSPRPARRPPCARTRRRGP